MLGNAPRIQELIAKREKLAAEFVKVDEELLQLTGGATEQPSSARAKQKCTFILPDGTKCGSTEHNKRFHEKTGAASGAAT